VCGLRGLEEPAYDERGTPSLEICRSCGFQFGFDDDDQHIPHEEWRRTWIEGGMRWWSSAVPPPPGWDPVKQLRDAGLIEP
jgi:hypothetical protein